MPDMKLQDMQLADQVTGHENARHENTGHEFARQDKYSYENRLHYTRVCISFNF